MADLVASWMQAVHGRHPEARMQLVRGSRFTAEGVRSALRGQVSCVTFAREPFPAEVRGYRDRYGSGPILIPVAQGSYRTPHGTFAIAVYVNRANPLRRLDMRQLRRVLSAGTGQGGSVHTWGDLGATGGWRDRPVHVYGMQTLRATGNPPGIVNFMRQRVLGGEPWRSDLRERTDAHGLSALDAIVRSVAQDPDGIGYSGIGYARPSVVALALSRRADGPFFPPTKGNVAKARYPLARRIYLGFNPGLDASARRAACQLLAVALGQRGYSLDRADAMHFLPLTAAQTRAAERLAHREIGCSLPHSAEGARETMGHGVGRVRRGGRPRTLTIIGYNDMAGIFRRWNRAFAKMVPGVRIRVLLPATRAAPMALAEGRSQIAPMGAPFSARQLRAYRGLQAADPVGFKVAHATNDPRARSSPIGIYVHPSNPVRFVTMDQLRQIFGGTAFHSPPTWSLLGLHGAWATRRIDACGLAPATALGQYMLQRMHLNHGFVSGYLAFSESHGALQDAARDRRALCFGDLDDAATQARRLGILANADGIVHTGTRRDIQSGTYPLDRFLYIYVRKHAASSARGPLLCRYLSMVLSARGQALLAASPPGYIPLNPAELRAQRKRLGRIGCRQGGAAGLPSHP